MSDSMEELPDPMEDMSDSIAALLNDVTLASARAALERCCGSQRWVAAMLELRPFLSDEALLAAADDVWQKLDREDWLEAFGHHPRIGERRAAAQSPAAQLLSEQEQAGMTRAAAAVKEAMVEKNLRYEARFGHVFLICATGRSGEEMLAELDARLGNDPDSELRVAAAEHALITRIRLRKLVEADSFNTRESP